ncbi:uncharacterized protein [Ptychodera flava]|uniref:uncharacterized protein isoform X2 n=1 Tax=Ptychodera flava TaxID=63121 RepID=UPI00396A95EC
MGECFVLNIETIFTTLEISALIALFNNIRVPIQLIMQMSVWTRLMRGHPAELVGDVFRCLVSILRNQDGRVITPLLTTGDQGFPKKIMLQSMVEGAVNWIKAGLPLRKLKIVLFANVEGTNQVQQAKKRFEDISQIFSELKQKYEGQQFMPEEVPIQYDVYLSYSEKDSESAMKLKESLQKMKKDIKIFLEQQELVADEVWQDTIYQVMLTCAKVVAVLSPAYLASSRCMEQYNIALCCNRKTKRDMLAPFYIENITVMPTYMGLVQYVDCRPHAVEKIEAGCQHLIDSLSTSLSSTSSNQRTLISQHSQCKYDVFISYSHKNSSLAALFLNTLQSIRADLRIFFDTQELKTGTAWQETLYQSIDGSRCMIACVSKDYLQSQVCQEEYNLALAKHLDKEHDLQLIPVCLEDVISPPLEFTKLAMADCRTARQQGDIQPFCHQIVKMLDNANDISLSSLQKPKDGNLIDIRALVDEYQQHIFTEKYGKIRQTKLRETTTKFRKGRDAEKMGSGDQLSCDIAFSFAEEDRKYAKLMVAILKQFVPSLVINDTVSSDHTQLGILESATKVVCLVSPHYVESRSQIEEFHIALFRHRSTRGSTVLFPIQVTSLPRKPTYFQLIPCIVSCTTPVWKEVSIGSGIPETLEDLRKDIGKSVTERVSREDSFALYKAAEALLVTMTMEREHGIAENTDRNIVLLNVIKMMQTVVKTTDTNDKENVQQSMYPLPNEEMTNLASNKGILDVHGKTSDEKQGQKTSEKSPSNEKTLVKSTKPRSNTCKIL